MSARAFCFELETVLHYPTRQQIVVFPEAKDLLCKAEWHHSESNEIADEV